MRSHTIPRIVIVSAAALLFCLLLIVITNVSMALSSGASSRAELVTNGDFSDGFNGWWSTTSVTPDASSGELVAVITDGGTNPWDAIVGQHGIPVESGVAYTITVDAKASEAATINLVWQEDGGDFVFYGGGALSLTTDMETYTFMAVGPEDNPAATFQFQMGGVGNITVTLDNISVESADGVELGDPLQNGNFEGLEPWFTTDSISPIIGNGILSATITTGGDNPWDAIVGQPLVEIFNGQHYVLTFEAYASEAKTVKLVWQEDGGDFVGYFNQDIVLGDGGWQTYAYRIDGIVTDPAATLQFQMGGMGEFDFYLRNAALVIADPAPTMNGNVLANGTFEDEGAPWWVSDTAATGSAEGDGTYKVEIFNGGVNAYDAILGQHGVPIYAGMPYSLTFTAWASEVKTVNVLWQLNGGAFTRYFDEYPELTTTPQQFTYEFVGSADNAAASFQFHLGGQGEYDFYVQNVTLFGPVPDIAEEVQPVHLNQTGYLPDAPKVATIRLDTTEPVEWAIEDPSRIAVMSGLSTVFGFDAASGTHVHQVDFSDLAAAGSGYKLIVDGLESHPFDIGAEIYADLQYEALAYFYHNRSGIALTMPYAGGDQWTRPAGHVDVAPNQGDGAVPCFTGPDLNGNEYLGCDYTLDLTGGWYDAGDHGKYVVNGGISLWTLMNLYERALYSPYSDVADFADGSMNIPENANGVPDLLDEARWQMEFMMKMQVPMGGTVEGEMLGGMVHHKMADIVWTGLGLPPDQDPQPRVVYPPSTAATLNMAATAAQCARLFATYDADFAASCLESAETAWTAALANPDQYAQNNFTGSGPYDDDIVSDEFYWAAVELYLTTDKQVYLDFMLASPHHLQAGPEMWWREVAPLGTVSLAVVPEIDASRDGSMMAAARANLTAQADVFVDMIDQEGYRLPYRGLLEARGDATIQQIVTNGDFADGETDWWSTDSVDTSVTAGTLTADVTDGGMNPWDAIVGHHDVPVEAGQTYTVSFVASANPATPVSVVLQENGGMFTGYFGADVALTPTPTLYTYVFTSPASDDVATFQFQMGGQGEFTVTLADVSIEYAEYAYGDRVGAYDWGSNSSIVNNSLVIGLAHEFQAGRSLKYINAVSEAMDYLMGHNPMDQSYVTGYGERPLMNPHHRFWANQLNPLFPSAPPGVMSGGPNSSVQDPLASAISGCAPQTCFLDHIDSWSTNEITINWNAPFAWMVTFLNDHAEFDDPTAVTLSSHQIDAPVEDAGMPILLLVTALGMLITVPLVWRVRKAA